MQINVNEVINRYKAIVSDLEYELILKDIQIEELMKTIDKIPEEVTSEE